MNLDKITNLLDEYRVTDGKKFKLKHYKPGDLDGDTGLHDKAEHLLAGAVAELAKQQRLLAEDGTWSMLCVFQGIDAAGKDGTIRAVMTGVNPQGVAVTSFKVPGPEALAHDFLWRVHQAVPERGRIGIFNRSHYEEVLVARVHPDVLDHQHLPQAVRGKKFWEHRLEDIANFEQYLSRQGVVVLKFFLHISKEEQKKRLLARINKPTKHWKFTSADLRERDYFEQYNEAFEEAIAATAAPHAPWYVVPGDHKWFAHLIVVGAMVHALHGLGLKTPELPEEERQKLDDARARLEAE